MKSIIQYLFVGCLAIALSACNNSSSSNKNNAVLPAQTGSISVNPTTGLVTVSTDFKNLDLVPGTASFDSGNNTLTIPLAVVSKFTQHVLFNPKVWISSTSEGSLDTTDAFSSSFEGTDYVYYGPEAMAANKAVSRNIVLTGVSGSSDVTVDLSLTDSPMLIGRGDERRGPGLSDSATGLHWGDIDCAPQAFTTLDVNALSNGAGGNKGCGARNVVVSPDGRTFYTSNKTHPTISAIDTVTYNYTTLNLRSDSNDQGLGSVAYVVLSNNGSKLYALVNYDVHMTASNTNSTGQFDGTTPVKVEVVEVDTKTFTVIKRGTLLTTANGDVRARNINLSPDGSKLALLIDGDQSESGVYLLKASDLSLIDSSNMPIKLDPAQVFAKKVIFANNTTLAVAYGGYASNSVTDDTGVNPDVITLIDTSSSSYTQTNVASVITAVPNGSGYKTNVALGSLERDDKGMIYWTRDYNSNGWLKNGAAYTGSELLSIINPADGSEKLVALDVDTYSGDGRGLGAAVAIGKDDIYVGNDFYGNYSGSPGFAKIDRSTDLRVDYDGDTTNGIIGNSDAGAKVSLPNRLASGHELAITPF